MDKIHENKQEQALNKVDVHGETEIDLLEMFFYLLENIKYVIIAAAIGLVISGIYTFIFVTPMYEATSKLYVMNRGDSAINISDLQIGTYLASDYQEVFGTWEVSELVIQNLALSYSYSRLQSMLTVTNPSDTRILYIKVSSSDPEEAAEIANEFASVAQKYIAETMETDEPNVLSNALEPVNPVSPNKTRNLILGFLLGGLIAAGIFVIRFILDDRIKTADDLMKYLGMPTLAVVPTLGAVSKGKRSYTSQRR